MLKENVVPQKEIRLLAEEAEKQQKPAARAAVLGYGRQNRRPENAKRSSACKKKKS